MSDDLPGPTARPARSIRAVNPDEPPSPLDLLRRELADDRRWSSARPLAEMCGGVDALLTLDASPTDLSNEPREARAGGVFAEPLRRVDQALGTYHFLFDAEHRAIVRRLFDAALHHPTRPLERRSDPMRIVAAVTWIALVGNMEIGRGRGRLSADLLWYELGVTSCADLGRKSAADLGMRAEGDDGCYRLPCGDIRLGDVALLHTSTRRWIIDLRDGAASAIEQIEHRRAEARPMRRRGNQVELRGSEIGVLAALKVQPERRQVVMVLLGDEVDDPDEILALSIPDAHRLVQLLRSALAGPPAPFSVKQAG